MRALLRAGLDAGGIGFSSSWARTHNDAEGHMVPSRYAIARRDRRAVRDGRRVRGHVARVHPDGRPVRAVGGRADGRRCRPPRNGRSTGTCSASTARTWTTCEQKLDGAAPTRARTARQVVALTMPMSFPVLPLVPVGLRPRRHARAGKTSWRLPLDEKLAFFDDDDAPAHARRASRRATTTRCGARELGQPQVIYDVVAPENEQYRGRMVGDIAEERGPRARGTCSSTSRWPTSSTPASAPCRAPRPTTTGRRASRCGATRAR